MSGDGEDKKVINMATRKLNRGKKENKETQITQAELFEIYADILDKKGKRGVFEPMPQHFKIYRTSTGNKMPLQIDESGVCSQVSTEIIADALTEYWRTHYSTDDSMFLNPRKAEQIVTHWIRGSETIDEPKSILWADEPGCCYRRLPFNYDAKNAFPSAFFELLQRMSNSEAFCMFLGSLFFEGSNRQQYVWIYGHGNNGKGSLSRFLHRIFGGAYAALNVPQNGGARFWNHQLLNIRLGFFNECSSPKFTTSAFFKTLTGNDPIAIEQKGKAIITAKINTKFIFTSNERPVLSNETADHRRAIICELQGFTGDEDPNYDDKLWAEGQDILSYCRELYASHIDAHGHKSIPVMAGDLMQYSAEEDDRFDSIFAQYFVLSAGDSVSAQKFGNVMREAFGTRQHDERQFRMWLGRNHGVSVHIVKRDGRSIRQYPGIKMNSIAGIDPY